MYILCGKHFRLANRVLRLPRRRKTSKASQSDAKWNSVVGLEIHAQLNTKSKLFSGAENTFGAVVNNCVSLFDAAIPGTLPVLNRRCVELGVMAALALSCRVHEVSMFDRKHYFYADLPAGYQITQQRAPLASDGELQFQVFTPGVHRRPYVKRSRIKQVQLEQDSGKSLHDADARRSLVDLNRAGAPLIELVFEPDLEDGEEAAALVKELVLIVGRLGACSGRMEEGAVRVDANVSLHRPGAPLGTRTEIKNIGSVRGVAGAVNHEIQRQMAVLEAGGVVVNQTRAWDATTRTTVAMRDKEVVQDYRFMPEPNLPPLRLNLSDSVTDSDTINVSELRDSLPELPEQSRQHLIQNHNLKPEAAIQLVNEDKLLKYFRDITADKQFSSTKVANMLLNELLTCLNKNKLDLEHCEITSTQLTDILRLINDRRIDNVTAVKVLDCLVNMDRQSLRMPQDIVEENGWYLVVNEDEITKLCEEAIKDNPKMVQQYKNGKVKVFKAFMGLIAKKSESKVDMASVSRKLEEMLKK